MARVVGHLSLEELQAGYRGSGDGTLARHYQVIWLLAQGRTCPEVAGLTSFAVRWVEQLLARYNAFGPRSLGDRRRGNGAAPTVLTAAMLAAVRERVRRPPDDGGVWTARKVATFMAAELGRRVAEQRGWEALRAIGWTIQSPRPQHAAQPAQLEALADAIEELDVELALQVGQGATHRGLRHGELLGRPADALAAGDRQEDLELAQGVAHIGFTE